jgi:hypothetical protein
MAEYIIRGDTQDNVFYYTRFKALKVFLKARQKASGLVATLLIPALFLSPLFFIIIFLQILEVLWVDIIYEFFYDKKRFDKYQKIMQPKSASEVLTVVGYRVFEEELDEHLGLVGDRTPTGAQKLGDKQAFMETDENGFRKVGFDKKLLTTHFLIPGKTGSGKTEGIRSIADDVLRLGGGFLFNDGKSDEGMLREFQNQAKRAGRETSCYVLNFLKAEKMAESNTFSPLGIMHPVKIVEFFGSLINGGGGDGNAAYFFNRGKAMLFPVVNATYIRDKYLKEGFSIEKIFENTTVINISILYIALYCMARDINENIRRSPRLSVSLSSSTAIVTDQNFKEIERLVDFITQNPTQKDIVQEAGISFVEVKEIYSNSYLLIKGYLEKVWNQYGPLLSNISGVIYKMSRQDGYSFFGEDAINILDIKKQYNTIKEIMLKKDEALARDFQRKYGLSSIELTTLVDAFQNNKGTLENPPPDAIQQHSYAQQQWDVLSGIFTMYKHIFGQSRPEIRPDKLIRDNKFLYIVLPPLEMQADQVKILGKMIIMTIREVAAIALGGEKLSVHYTLGNIAKDKITPKPFTFVVLDEYGAYPVEGIDTLLAQVRSLNMSMAIAVQDYASLKAGGSDETSQQRALANTTKWLLKIEDDKAIAWIDSMLADDKRESVKYDRDAHGQLVFKQEVDVEKKKAFDAKKLRDFDNGFSVLLIGSDSDGVVFLQSFYRGGKKSNIVIKRYIPFDI